MKDMFRLRRGMKSIKNKNPKQKNKNFTHLLIVEKEKIETQKIVRIKYAGGSKKNESRPIRPLSLLPLPQGQVLYAHCLDTDLYKMYSLSKITECLPATQEDLEKFKKSEQK